MGFSVFSRPALAALVGLIVVSAASFMTPQPTSAQTDQSHPIVATALGYEGTHGGQCYQFVQQVVSEATGRTIGIGYRDGYLEAGAIEVDPATAQAGDILQIANPDNLQSYYPGMHTSIVLENLGNRSYTVIDSNWQWGEQVAVHEWTAREAPHLRLYAYRFPAGTVPTSASDAAPASNTGDTVVGTPSNADAVVVPGTCLRLRDGAGLGFATIDCLSAGTELQILSEPVRADGYAWVQVLVRGKTGWVASEFIRALPQTPVQAAAPATTPAPVAPSPTEAPAPPEPTPAPATATPPPAPATSVDAQAAPAAQVSYVDAPDSCLRVRDGAGLGQPILDCLRDGTALTVTGEGKVANGFTWVPVTGTSSSASGWVATEFLRAQS